MEAATAIFYGDNSVTGARSVRWRNVIIHEIAHQWWGNAVTENDWDHVWLSEGFATYFTLVYREYAYGRDDFLAGLADARRRVIDFYADDPHYRVVHDNLDPIGRGTVTNGMTYQRGAWFLHMLRGMLGEDRFWAGIRRYYGLYRDGNASTDDFREVMENTYEPSVDLSGFFEQWLYQGGIPHLRGGWSWDAATNELVIELEQIEDDGYAFEMPIPVRITVPPAAAASGARGGRGGRGGRGTGPQTVERHIMMLHARSQTRITLDRAPSGVVLDPDHWVLMEVEFRQR
jgi:aminopeptidase N